jgi:hypothetical protein
LFACHVPLLSQGQSVKCVFTLNTQQIQGTKDIFTEMKSTINNFINTTTWVNLKLKPHELIECNFILTLKEQISENEFRGALQIQAQRPVYNTTYKTVTLNAVDNDVEFHFASNEELDFSLMSHNPYNLASLLAYWVYIVMGIDFDTFSSMGGAPYFRNAERIVQNAQSDSKPGWSATSGSSKKNRYWLIENILNTRYEKERKAYYAYHRLGLDNMNADVKECKKTILQALKTMQELHNEKPDNALYFFSLFFDAKADEIVNIFSESNSDEKKEVRAILSEINVANEQKYKRLNP